MNAFASHHGFIIIHASEHLTLRTGMESPKLLLSVKWVSVHIKFIIDTAIYDPEWKIPILVQIGKLVQIKMADGSHFAQNDEEACTRHNFVICEIIKFIFDIAIDQPENNSDFDQCLNRFKLYLISHLVNFACELEEIY